MSGRESARFVILDRDGVINEVIRDGYVMNKAALRLLPGSADAIAELNRARYEVVVVSNQQCVGLGMLRREELDSISGALCSLVAAESGGCIADFFYCLHLRSEQCSCRKPEPGLLLQAQERHGFDLSETWFVGDAYPDMETARQAGCRAMFVLSGLDAGRYEAGDPLPHTPEFVAQDLGEAVRHILEEGER